jgi:predicted transcriptional regulator
MRTTENLTVSLPPAVKRAMQKTAKKENRTMSELVRETWRHYQLKQRVPVNYDLIAALQGVQDSARRVGLDRLTEREINAEVIAHRRERDKKTKQPVR